MGRQESYCVDCGGRFTLYPKKPGRVNQCTRCGRRTEEGSGVERLGGNMIYAHKTGGEIEIKPMSEAKKFARKTRRLGAGVTASLTESKLKAEEELEGESNEWRK